MAVAVVLGVNLLSGFEPPTWSIMVLFKPHSHLDPVALVASAALAAAHGRYVLAVA